MLRRCAPGSTAAGGGRSRPCGWVRPPPSRKWHVISVASTSRTRPGRSRPEAWAAGMPPPVSAACGQATSRAWALAVRSAASIVESMSAGSRHAVVVEATGPNTVGWSRRMSRSRIASPPSASITAMSTAIRPGACPVPRGRILRSTSVGAAVRPVASARSAGRRDPAWLTTPWPSAETTSRGREAVVCTQKVPSCWNDRSLGQALSSQVRWHFRVLAQDPDTAQAKRRG